VQQFLGEFIKDNTVVDICSPLLQFLEANAAVLQSILFRDKAHFYLNGYINKQNMYMWATENLHGIMEAQLHSQKCTVWCAVLAHISRSIFLKDALNAGHHLYVLEEQFFTFLQGKAVSFEETIFEQDGA
jgi:hypothetical protein